MKKGILIICLLFVAIGLGNVLIYKIWPPKVKKQAEKPATSANQTGGLKLTDALKSGSTFKCVFDDKAGEVARTGTIYINGIHIRTDYTVTQGKPGNSNSHLISDGAYFYIWTEQNTGLKLQISDFPGQNATSSAESLLNQYTAMDTNSEIKCLPWQPDMAVFTVPTNIDFKDMTQTMLNLKNSLKTSGTP
jgi:hypothetical protein